MCELKGKHKTGRGLPLDGFTPSCSPSGQKFQANDPTWHVGRHYLEDISVAGSHRQDAKVCLSGRATLKAVGDMMEVVYAR